MLAPHSPWAQKMIEHWDYATASIIVRTLLELRAAFHYLCVDHTTEEEWECRWSLLNLHDCNSRRRMLAVQSAPREQTLPVEKEIDRLQSVLRANRHFATLKHQQRLLNGGSAYLYPLEDILERSGFNRSTYKLLNIAFSSHVHGLPMSYLRMAAEDRGRGLPSPAEESSTTICFSLAAVLLTASRDELRELFKDLEKPSPHPTENS
jgi:hypothetical protein